MITEGLLILKGYENARNPSTTLGYLKIYDVNSRTDFSVGCTFLMDDAKIDRTPQVYVMELGLREGKYGLQATCTNIQIKSPNGK